MAKRIGLVQTRGIGDIIIALPIAQHFLDEGYEVVWPIDAAFVAMFEAAKPEVEFLPVERGGADYWLKTPLELIKERECERTVILYSNLTTMAVFDTRLAASFKFDEYKYAMAGVPFARKWELQIERDMAREQRLFDGLGVAADYVCFHGQSSDMAEPLRLPPNLAEGMQVVEMTKRSDDESPFDWLLTMERASKLVLIDSCFANLAEQLNLPNRKTFIYKNPVSYTPVFRNAWHFKSIDMVRSATGEVE